jgi:hypothetical protein
MNLIKEYNIDAEKSSRVMERLQEGCSSLGVRGFRVIIL